MTLSAQSRCSLTFLSTPSGWRATTVFICSTPFFLYFYPRPPGGGRLPDLYIMQRGGWISIHALRVEGDPPKSARPMKRWCTFLSTPSGWRATWERWCLQQLRFISIHALRVEGDIGDHTVFQRGPVNFYPRPPGGGRHLDKEQYMRQVAISIHALRVEGDCTPVSGYCIVSSFLSTPSGWRATISGAAIGSRRSNFYPRPPGGGRRGGDHAEMEGTIFLSTPSGWRATEFIRLHGPRHRFLSTPSGWRAT